MRGQAIKRITIGVLFLVMVGTTALMAQAPKEIPDEKVTIRFSWWGGDSRNQATLAAIDLYMKAHPNVIIEPEYSGFSGYYKKLVTQLVSSNAPDVFQSDQGWTSAFFKRGDVFADLSKFPSIRTDDFNSQMIEDYCMMGDNLVVLPMGFNGTVFVYNKDMLAPYLNGIDINNWSWEDMIRVGESLHAAHADEYLTTNITDAYVRFVLKPYLEQVTNTISIKDDYTLGFKEEQMTETFAFIQRLFVLGVAQPYAESAIYKDSLQDNPKWKSGQIAGAAIFISNIKRETENLPFTFDVTRLPLKTGAKTSGQESGPSLMIAINKKSKVQEEAAKFVDWLLNDPEAASVLSTERGTPANSVSLQVLKDQDILTPLMAKAMEVSNASIGFKNGALEMNASIHAIFVEKMERVIYKKASAEQASTELMRELQRRLDEMKTP